MRSKIVVNTNPGEYFDLYSAIEENGNCISKHLSEQDVDYLITTGYFDEVDGNLGLFIGISEESVVCEISQLVKLLDITTEFRHRKIFDERSIIFLEISEFVTKAIESNTCLYIIL